MKFILPRGILSDLRMKKMKRIFRGTSFLLGKKIMGSQFTGIQHETVQSSVIESEPLRIYFCSFPAKISHVGNLQTDELTSIWINKKEWVQFISSGSNFCSFGRRRYWLCWRCKSSWVLRCWTKTTEPKRSGGTGSSSSQAVNELRCSWTTWNPPWAQNKESYQIIQVLMWKA